MPQHTKISVNQDLSESQKVCSCERRTDERLLVIEAHDLLELVAVRRSADREAAVLDLPQTMSAVVPMGVVE